MIRFALTAILLFVAFMALGKTGFYPPLFRAAASPLLRNLGSHRIATLEPFDHPEGRFDTRLSLGTDASGTAEFKGDMLLDTFRAEYVPTALVAALVLATPLAWGRRFKALALGLGLLHVFLALRLVVVTLWGFSNVGPEGGRLLELGRSGTAALTMTELILRSDFHLTYVVAIVVWVFVTRVEGRYLSFFKA